MLLMVDKIQFHWLLPPQLSLSCASAFHHCHQQSTYTKQVKSFCCSLILQLLPLSSPSTRNGCISFHGTCLCLLQLLNIPLVMGGRHCAQVSAVWTLQQSQTCSTKWQRMLLNRMRIHETKCLCKGLEESKWETSVDQEEIRLCFLLSFIWLVSTANQRWFTRSL